MMKVTCQSILFILSFVGCVSCSNGVRPSDPSSYLGTGIILPAEIDSLSDASRRIIIYLDLSDCVSCELKSLKMMDEDLTLFNELNEINDCLDIIFVVNREKNEMIDAALSRLQAFFPIKIVYDTGQTFTGKFIPPTGKQYHCFLVDDSGIIRLIGFPYMNGALKGKYVSQIFGS